MPDRRDPSPSPPPAGKRGVAGRLTQGARWRWLKRGIGTLFFIGVGYLLVTQAHTIEWSRVLVSLQHYPVAVACGAAALVMASFAMYSCFDLLGRHYTGHALGTATVMLLTVVSYAFNLNLGSVVGGVAFRYRLYSRLGLGLGVITRVMSISMLANWMGYVLLAGLVFSLQPPAVPAHWRIDALQLRLAGAVLLVIAGAYLSACAFLRRRLYVLRGHAIALPSLRLAGLQMLMGAGNWLLMAGTLFVLLRHKIDFFTVVGVLLLATVAGVATHVPGNLGVLEAVFVALLSHRMPPHDLLAGMVAYRVIYYLVPLAIATVVYFLMEARIGQRPVLPGSGETPADAGAPRR